jgi:hypothetical protein
LIKRGEKDEGRGRGTKDEGRRKKDEGRRMKDGKTTVKTNQFRSAKELLINKPVIFIVLILMLAIAIIVGWRHYRHRSGVMQAQMITRNGGRPLSKAELAVVNKQTQYFNTNINHGMPSSLPQDVRRNMDTINEIQRINQLNRKQR